MDENRSRRPIRPHVALPDGSTVPVQGAAPLDAESVHRDVTVNRNFVRCYGARTGRVSCAGPNQAYDARLTRKIGRDDFRLAVHALTICMHDQSFGEATECGGDAGRIGAAMKQDFQTLIRMFSDQESIRLYRESLGKLICYVTLKDDVLTFNFYDGTDLRVTDEGPLCCGARYMEVDADLKHFSEATLRRFEVRDAADGPVNDTDECRYCHEIQFLVVETDKGSFTVATHNEHNGCYGGFSLQLRRSKRKVRC